MGSWRNQIWHNPPLKRSLSYIDQINRKAEAIQQLDTKIQSMIEGADERRTVLQPVPHQLLPLLTDLEILSNLHLPVDYLNLHLCYELQWTALWFPKQLKHSRSFFTISNRAFGSVTILSLSYSSKERSSEGELTDNLTILQSRF